MPGSKMWGRRLGSIPGPWSWMLISTLEASAVVQLMWMVASAGL